MANQKTQGIIRPNRGYAAFRIVFGLFFVGLGINQFSRFPASGLPYFSLGIGLLFIGYGIVGLIGGKGTGNRIELETPMPSTTDRLAELSKLKAGGLISDQEYETKRQDILKDL